MQINKGMIGFLTHTGFAHGGNGFEGIRFLIESFKDTDLLDAGAADHGLDLKTMATNSRWHSMREKSRQGARHAVRNIPCVNHPVFKGRQVNKDPREVYIGELFAEARGEKNVFHDFTGRWCSPCSTTA